MEIVLEIASEKEHRRSTPRVGSLEPGSVQDYPLLGLQQRAGNQAVQHLLRSGLIQARLAANNPDDPYERQADRAAGRVMRAILPGSDHPGVSAIQGQADGEDLKDACRLAQEDCKAKLPQCRPSDLDMQKCMCWKGGTYGPNGYTCIVRCGCKFRNS